MDEDSLFSGIKRLPSASYAIYGEDGRLSIRKYYELLYNIDQKTKLTRSEAADEFRGLLNSAVEYRLIADVEVGIFLSSGIDSASILSLASRYKQNIKAFQHRVRHAIG